MKGNNEVKYSIYIITEYGKHWFNKTSIWNDNHEYESLHEITKSDYVYNTFCELYPILKEYDRENIEIHKCWESWHPVYDDKPRAILNAIFAKVYWPIGIHWSLAVWKEIIP